MMSFRLLPAACSEAMESYQVTPSESPQVLSDWAEPLWATGGDTSGYSVVVVL